MELTASATSAKLDTLMSAGQISLSNSNKKPGENYRVKLQNKHATNKLYYSIGEVATANGGIEVSKTTPEIVKVSDLGLINVIGSDADTNFAMVAGME